MKTREGPAEPFPEDRVIMAILLLASMAVHLLAGVPADPVQSALRARNLNRISREERIAYLTRVSPPPPDVWTAVYAAGALLAAGAILALRNRGRRPDPGSRRIDPPRLLVLASALWFGVFLVKGLAVPLFQPPRSLTREPYPFAPPSGLERFLRRLQERLPEDAGVMLLNCREPHRTDLVNYFLFPRKVVFTKASAVYLPDPKAYLTEENRSVLERLGADWILNLDPAVTARGPEAALIPVVPPNPHRREGGDRPAPSRSD